MTNMDNYCVIMGGGIGSRFWPFSRKTLPKQFLDFFRNRSFTPTTDLRPLSKGNPNRKYSYCHQCNVRRSGEGTTSRIG